MHAIKKLLYSLPALLLLLLACAPKTMQPSLSPEELLQHFRTLYKAKGNIKAEGVAAFRNANQTGNLRFACASAGDSLLRLDIFSPFGGAAGSLRVAHGRFRLRVQDEVRTGDTADIGRIFAEELGLPIPYLWIVHLFTARPYIPGDSAVFQVQSEGVLFQFITSGYTQKLRTCNSRPCETWVDLESDSTLHVQWARYKNNLPRQTAVTAPKGALDLRFGYIQRVEQALDSSLFKLE